MFSKLKSAFGKGKSEIMIASPLEGDAIPIAEVSDPTFSEEVLGKGIAIIPTGERIVSPVNGTLETIFDTGHACSLRSEDGAEILIHVGLDTVELKGQHFEKIASNGDKVKVGDPILKFNLAGIKEAGYDTVTMVVICNSPDYSNFHMNTGNKVKEGDEIIVLEK